MEKNISASGGENLYGLFRASAERFLGKPALHYSSATLTYGELNSEVNRLAKVLSGVGVTRGDRVFLCLPNSAAFFVSYLAAFRLGAVAVPFSTSFTPAEIASLLQHSRASFGIVFDGLRDTVEAGVVQAGSKPTLITVAWDAGGDMRYSAVAHEAPSPSVPAEVLSGDPAVILYTSGTTGNPKGVVLSHRNIVSNVISCSAALPVSQDDVFITLIPMYHSFGFTVCTMLPLLLGSTCVVLPGPKKELIADAVKRFGVTVFVGIPALFGIMALADQATVPCFDTVRFFASGAAPLSIRTIEMFSRKYRAPLLEGYGLTEAAPVVSLNPHDGIRKNGSIGVPVPGVSVKVVGESGEELARGEVGELLVKGPNVMSGYFGDDVATEARIADGWLRSGDMARMDRDGYIYIEDRKDDMILVQGANVYPHEIEDLIRDIPGVLEVAVVGVSDSHLGKRPVAIVQRAKGASLDEATVTEHCRRGLSAHKVPRRVDFWDEIPLSPLGKPLKWQIREMLIQG